jgi:hypothetical protein
MNDACHAGFFTITVQLGPKQVHAAVALQRCVSVPDNTPLFHRPRKQQEAENRITETTHYQRGRVYYHSIHGLEC